MLDVIDQQFLVLHLMLQSQSNNRENFAGIVTRCQGLNEAHHLFVDMCAIPACFRYRGTRARAAFRPFDAGAEPFVIRIKVEEELFRVRLIARLNSLQHRLEKP